MAAVAAAAIAPVTSPAAPTSGEKDGAAEDSTPPPSEIAACAGTGKGPLGRPALPRLRGTAAGPFVLRSHPAHTQHEWQKGHVHPNPCSVARNSGAKFFANQSGVYKRFRHRMQYFFRHFFWVSAARAVHR